MFVLDAFIITEIKIARLCLDYIMVSPKSLINLLQRKWFAKKIGPPSVQSIYEHRHYPATPYEPYRSGSWVRAKSFSLDSKFVICHLELWNFSIHLTQKTIHITQKFKGTLASKTIANNPASQLVALGNHRNVIPTQWIPWGPVVCASWNCDKGGTHHR